MTPLHKKQKTKLYKLIPANLVSDSLIKSGFACRTVTIQNYLIIKLSTTHSLTNSKVYVKLFL